MNSRHDETQRAAVEWLAALNDPMFDRWSEWETWLAEDARNAEIYWQLADREEMLVEGLQAKLGSPEPTSRVARTRRWPGRRAAAAVLAAAVLGTGAYILSPFRAEAEMITVTTSAGEMRDMRLADGTILKINGDTRLQIGREDPRNLVLDRGQATFVVAHDPDRPFSVDVGDAIVRDLGTVFDVTRERGGLRVAVAEGLVEYVGKGAPVRLRAGQTLEVMPGAKRIGTVATSDVGGWRSGRLSYANASLADVAADVARSLGVQIAVSPELAQKRFTGSFRIKGRALQMRGRLETILNTRIEADGREWTMRAPGRQD